MLGTLPSGGVPYLVSMPTQGVLASDVPILGQPVDVLGWTLVVQVQCRCERTGVLQLVMIQTPIGRGTNPLPCPSCGRLLHIQTLSMTPTGNLAFALGIDDSALKES